MYLNRSFFRARVESVSCIINCELDYGIWNRTISHHLKSLVNQILKKPFVIFILAKTSLPLRVHPGITDLTWYIKGCFVIVATDFNPLTPVTFCKKCIFWSFWCFLSWISAKLALIRSKMLCNTTACLYCHQHHLLPHWDSSMCRYQNFEIRWESVLRL